MVKVPTLQPDSQAIAPIGDVRSETATACKCGAGVHEANADRCARGHALKANTLALTSGARSTQFWQAAEAERQRLRRELLANKGLRELDAPAALVAVADGAAQAVLLRDGAFQRLIDSGGPMTSADRARRVFAVWATCCERAQRALQAFGLERQARPAPSLDDLIQGSASPLDGVAAAREGADQ